MRPHAMRHVLGTICLLTGLGSVEAKDNGQGLSRGDIENACSAAYEVCKASCQRPNTVSGQLQQSFCVDDCRKHLVDCIPDASAGKAAHHSKSFKSTKKAP